MKPALLTIVAVAGLSLALRAGDTFTDTFDDDHDYLADGTAGTMWDGLRTAVTVNAADANLTHAGELRLGTPSASGITNGPFLYKNITGSQDFTATVHVSVAAGGDYPITGLLVADASADTNYVCVYGVPSNTFTKFESHGGVVGEVWGTMGSSKWFRLVRTAGVYTAFRSDNGTSWTQFAGSLNSASLTGNVKVGMFVSNILAAATVARYGEFTLEVADPPPPGPQIIFQPQPVKAPLGGSATFSVTATGIEPLEYQWWKDGDEIADATDESLTINPVTEADAGVYSVVVRDENGSTASSGAALTIGDPVIVTQPQSVRADLGGTAEFSVTATGADPLEYQWRKNGEDIEDADEATYTITDVIQGDEGNYSVVVSDIYGSTTSANATLTIDIPQITRQPQPRIAVAGGTAMFSVTATSPHPLEYQWLFGGVDIDGANAASHTITGVTNANAGNYSVVVSNVNGSVTSTTAKLTVLPGGQIYQDDFETDHDFAGGNVEGTIWDGVLNAGNLNPGTETSGGVLHLPVTGRDIASAPMLYKTVPAGADFDVEVHMPFMSGALYSSGGLIARAPGAGSGNWVAAMSQVWAPMHRLNSTINGVETEALFGGTAPAFLRLQRIGDTFNYYTKTSAGGTWSLAHSLDRPDLAGELQVGIWHAVFDAAVTANRSFDNFMLWFQPPGPVMLAAQIERAPNGAVTLKWASMPGTAYAVDVSLDLETWIEFAAGLPAPAGVEMTYVIPPGSTPDPATEPRMFFQIREDGSAPPVAVFSEDFDTTTAPSLPAGWSTGANPADTATTAWELGAPTNAGPAAAHSGAQCIGTNIADYYGFSTDIWLRTPPIDLTPYGIATLKLRQFKDIENQYDFGSIRLLRAADDSQLAVLENRSVTGDSGGDWQEYLLALPEVAFDEPIKIEFQFESDDFDYDDFAGWYLDDVTVTVP